MNVEIVDLRGIAKDKRNKQEKLYQNILNAFSKHMDVKDYKVVSSGGYGCSTYSVQKSNHIDDIIANLYLWHSMDRDYNSVKDLDCYLYDEGLSDDNLKSLGIEIGNLLDAHKVSIKLESRDDFKASHIEYSK